VTISVKRVSDNIYNVLAIAAQWRGGEVWQPSEPLDGQSVVDQLAQRGFHVQDIFDAMAEADPEWARKITDLGRGVSPRSVE
jgi:hypothetical protein